MRLGKPRRIVLSKGPNWQSKRNPWPEIYVT